MKNKITNGKIANEDKEFACPEPGCKVKGTSWGALGKHYYREHPKENKKGRKCDICPEG